MKKMNTTYFVDFKAKVLKGKTEVELIEENQIESVKNSSYDFSNFNPIIKGSNFEAFSDEERYEYSEHVLKHINEVGIQDIVHWVNHGMVDKKKLNDKLGLSNYEEEESA